jgi:hypothetical protein
MTNNPDTPHELSWSLLPAACAGALTGFVLLNQWGAPFTLPPELADLPATAAPDKLAVKEIATVWMVRKNSMVSLAILAAALGCGLAAAAGAGRSGLAARLTRVGVASLMAGVAGAVGGFAGHLLLQQLLPLPEATLSPMLKTIAAHALAWAVAGAGLGMSLALSGGGMIKPGRTLASGIAGGVLAAIVYSPLGAIFFPLSATDLVVPSGTGNGAMWAAVNAVVLGAVFVGLSRTKTGTPAAVQSPEAA